MRMAFPWCNVIEIEAHLAPPGVVPEQLQKPFALGDAEARASCTARFVGDAGRADKFETTRSGEAQDDYDYFYFDEYSPSPGNPAMTDFQIEVRRSDGFVQQCEWKSFRRRPKFPYEKILQLAKSLGATAPAVTKLSFPQFTTAGSERSFGCVRPRKLFQ